MTTLSSHQLHTNLFYQLRGLSMAGAILHIGAHPDDEDVGMVAYMARKFGVRVAYWSATRGEGGQNRIGPYQGAALGVYRILSPKARSKSLRNQEGVKSFIARNLEKPLGS